MSRYIKTPAGVPSDMFLDIIRSGAGPFVTCGCGIDHYINEEYKDDDEYSTYESESIYYVELDGITFVPDCEKCRTRLRQYEDFIWRSRDTIRKYLHVRIKQELEWAEHESLMNKLIE